MKHKQVCFYDYASIGKPINWHNKANLSELYPAYSGWVKYKVTHKGFFTELWENSGIFTGSFNGGLNPNGQMVFFDDDWLGLKETWTIEEAIRILKI